MPLTMLYYLQKIALISALVINIVDSQSQDDINYYVDLVTEARDNALTYELPKNNEKYFADGPIQHIGIFDFVIVGGGSAGSVIANSLSEISKWRILLLEAGHYGNDTTDVPNLFTPVQFTDYNWAYNTTPQTSSCLGMTNNSCAIPRGRGVGGSSLINSLVHARGYKIDYDTWAELSDNPRWSFDSVLNYFKRAENFIHNDLEAPFEPEFHGLGGYQNVDYHLPHTPPLDVFLAGNKELGFEIVDYNANKLGASPTQIYTFKGRRFDNGKAFIRPVKARPNLKILTKSFATKIVIQDKKACGVIFSHKGAQYFAEGGEVILSAGAVGSPQLLMLSGVGPEDHLESLGINVIENLGVGSVLRDNPAYFGLIFSSNVTANDSLKEDVVEFLRGRGPLTIPSGGEGLGFYESSYTKGTGIPEIELKLLIEDFSNPLVQRSFHFSDETFQDLFGREASSFGLIVVDLHSKSSGTLRLKSKNPYDFPLIDTRWLEDPENRDINTLYEGIELALKLTSTEAFKSIDTRLVGVPLRACNQYQYLSRDYWYCSLKQLTANLYHPMGTCPMGVDPKNGAVVDSELKVFGIEKLRIADASIFPRPIAGHTNAAATMVGQQLADIIKEAHGLIEMF